MKEGGISYDYFDGKFYVSLGDPEGISYDYFDGMFCVSLGDPEGGQSQC